MRQLLINDIYPLEVVTDTSLYYLISLVVLVSFLIFILLRWSIINHKHKKNKELRYCVDILKQNNSSSSRTTAYRISYYGSIIAKTNREKNIFQELNESLDIYKYQKHAPDISPKVQCLLKDFIAEVESRYV